MKTLFSPLFIAGCTTWIIVLTARRTGYPLPYINGYINDAFAIPVIANFGLWFQRVVVYKSDYYVLSPWHVVFITIYVSAVFEGLLPLLSKSYIADWRDIALYITGGVLFMKFMNKPIYNASR